MAQQIALITGAAGGFGEAIARALLEKGYHVVLTDTNITQLEHLKNDLLPIYSKVTALNMDVTEMSSVKDVLASLQSLSGELSVLVNNAGIIGTRFCMDEKCPAEAKKIFDVNLLGCFNCASVFSKEMLKYKKGRIINIASIAGLWGAAGSSAYAASKAGLIKASESWARELGPFNISVVAVAPGICKTNMYQSLMGSKGIPSGTEDKMIKSIIPIGRLGTAEDISEVVTFLATAKTNFLNGAVIEIDGGMRIGSL